MNYGPLIFLATFFALSASWFGFVLTPQVQLGREGQATNTVNTAELYPQTRPGLARQGAEVYRANGCAYCHSQQVRQTGVAADVLLIDPGTNLVAVADALTRGGDTKANAAGLAGGLPKTVLKGISFEKADAVTKELKAAGAKADLRIVALGPDIARGWGLRRTVAEDFLFDYPVMPGNQRVGPDLANVGRRLPDPNWQYLHLYAPSSVVKGSPMPAYKFLFEERKVSTGQAPAPDALRFNATGNADEKTQTVPADREIVPTQNARALVAYLMSLHADVPLASAPMAAPIVLQTSATTNAVGK
jgi:cbb3-type cytochrome oxidase cytochrome c subunit